MKTSKKNQILKVSLISMLLFVVAQLSAKEFYSISGQVINNRTESIKGAIVKLVNPVTFENVGEAKCKEDGKFYIDAVPAGEYNLVVKKDGVFRAKVKRVILDENGNYYVKNKYENEAVETTYNFTAAN